MILEVNNLTCGYSSGRPVVKDLSMELFDHDVCCILGKNGVGKSTMFKTMLQLLPAIRGRVLVDGEDISRWSPARMAETMAYVAQSHTPPFPYLVEEIVMMGRMNHIGPFGSPKAEDRAVVDRVMEELGIEHLRKKPYTEVSGGERQMTLVARALTQEPKILVMDEPTANLDYGNKVLVLECIQSLAQRGICTIFTTHDPEQALLLNAKTVMLFPDQKAAFGPAAEVVTKKNLREAYQATIQVVEILNEDGIPVRVCLPVLGRYHPR